MHYYGICPFQIACFSVKLHKMIVSKGKAGRGGRHVQNGFVLQILPFQTFAMGKGVGGRHCGIYTDADAHVPEKL